MFDTYLQQQTVMVFASTAARDTALSAVLAEGMTCYVTATDRYYTYTGSAWVVTGASTATGRVGCSLSRAANQSISNATDTAIIWDTEAADTDGFITVSNATVTVPTGMGGLYMITARLTGASAWGSNANDRFWINAASVDYNVATWSGTTLTATILAPLAAAHTVAIWLKQNTGGAVNFTGSLSMYRLSA